MTKKGKMLTWLIPIGIAVILFLAQWVDQINNERQLPSQDWSRTVHPDIPSNFETPYVYKDSDGIHLFTLGNKEIIHSVLNDQLKVTHKSIVKTKSDAQRLIWANNTSMIYKMNGQLIYKKGNNVKTIAKDVTDAKISDEGILYYAQKSDLVTFNLKSGQTEVIQTLSDPIENVAVDKEYVVLATQDSNSDFHFFAVSTKDPHANAKEIALFNGMSHGNISVMDVIQHDGKLGLYFTTHILKQGEYFYDYYLEYSPEQIASGKSKPINASFITFTVKGTGEYLRTPMDTQLYLKNGQPTLLFSAEGNRTLRDSAINIYEGYQNESGQWMAIRLSTSPEMSQLPFLVDNHTVGWLDYVSDNHYQVSFASQNPTIIDQSKKLKTQDLSHSFSNAALSLSRVFMLFLLMIAYAIPVILVYAIISFTKVELIERDSQFIKWLLLGIFLLSQYFLVAHTETLAFHLYAPGYLTFKFSSFVIPTLMALITLILVKWAKTKDWGIATEAFYAMIVFSIMVLFTFGPYFF